MTNNRSHVLQNSFTLAHRNLLKTLHNPDQFMDVLVQPVLFMLLFGYLFGGAIAGSVHAYLPTIVPGILVQTVLSAASGSGAQIREDVETGIFDRFKSLPIAHVAPLAGQLFGDVLRLVVATGASLLTGYCMGWRPTVGFGWLLIVLGLAVFIGWAISWIYALVGLLSSSAAMVQSFSLMTMLLLAFLSNAFVPIKTLPRVLQVVANLNPITDVITAIRQILATGTLTTTAWLVLVMGIGIVVVFAPLTVWAYDRRG